jgi:hypothetical protein
MTRGLCAGPMPIDSAGCFRSVPIVPVDVPDPSITWASWHASLRRRPDR